MSIKVNIPLAFFGMVCGAMLVASWRTPAPERPAGKPPAVKAVASKSYYIGEHEHLVIIDIPDRFIARRCLVYANEATHTTNMNCNFDDAGSPFPPAEQE